MLWPRPLTLRSGWSLAPSLNSGSNPKLPCSYAYCSPRCCSCCSWYRRRMDTRSPLVEISTTPRLRTWCAWYQDMLMGELEAREYLLSPAGVFSPRRSIYLAFGERTKRSWATAPLGLPEDNPREMRAARLTKDEGTTTMAALTVRPRLRRSRHLHHKRASWTLSPTAPESRRAFL